ncbi:MAG: Holliday junction branch migration protein RuvA [Bacilli bacterium]|nr:Holliday junction branch migration protein RuvA [Bacilli bacterium]
MYSYIIGNIVEIESDCIVVDNHGIGYKVFTPNPYAFCENSEAKVYLYQQIKEDEHLLYGFKNREEKELFLKLISVKGLGPKMALPIIAMGSPIGISDAINRENVLYLKKFPKIGDKLARQMILDLKGKITVSGNVEETSTDEVYEALLALGYKDKDIKGVLGRINKELSIENQIKEALKLMIK